MNTAELKELLAEFVSVSRAVEQKCREFCANESIPVSERWEIFCLAPNKETDSYSDFPDHLFNGEISYYDDFFLEKYQLFDVVVRLNEWTNDVKEGRKWPSFIQKLTPSILDLIKNYYMVKYLGSWKHNW